MNARMAMLLMIHTKPLLSQIMSIKTKRVQLYLWSIYVV